MFDKPKRDDGTFSREDFTYDVDGDVYVCPAGKILQTTGRLLSDGATFNYRASTYDCGRCPLKAKCTPKEPQRKIQRSKYEGARDMARDIAKTEAYETSRKNLRKWRCCLHTSNVF